MGTLNTKAETLTETEDHRRQSGGRAGSPHLFLAFECADLAAAGARYRLSDVDEVLLGRGESREAKRTSAGGVRRLCLSVADRRMSSAHARLTRVLGRWVLEDAGSKNGVRVNGAVQQRSVLADGDLFELGRSFFIYRESKPLSEPAPADLDGRFLNVLAPGMGTLLPELADELARLEAVARSKVSVLIRGETGTGKELAARAVHSLSGRQGEFTAVNCGALPANLVESELFGHKKGAFSGADRDREGIVRASDRGTLFLDEIGDLPPAAQAALLRVLQQEEVQAIGATRAGPVDLRVVAATHRDLEALVAKGSFRADLLARLSGFRFHLPALRDRKEDLGLILKAVALRLSPGGAPDLSPEVGRALLAYSWPMNIRELEKCLSAAVVLAGERPIRPEHLPGAVREAKPPAVAAIDEAEGKPLSPDREKHRDELIAVLRQHSGNVSAVAKAFGKARMQVQRWMKRYGLDPAQFRS
ncbi:MAG: sigma 54-interacting transcriptional regulator [Myxococcales bacterium]|nr:sigma 54-interacting transcriptional regulator [Myxococcales bacterium]